MALTTPSMGSSLDSSISSIHTVDQVHPMGEKGAAG